MHGDTNIKFLYYHVKEIKSVTIFVGSITLNKSISQYLSSGRAYLSVVDPTEQRAHF